MEQYGQEIMEEIAFWRSRVILTGAEIDVFTRLDEGMSTAPALSARMGTDSRATERLLDGLTALGLLEKQGDVFSLSSRGRFLSSRHPETVLPMIVNFNRLWQKWSRLTDVVRTGKPADATGATGGEEGEAGRSAFIGAMHVIGRHLSREIARAFHADRFTRLLDIGGGSGTYTAAFLRQNPRMTAVLFDLESVIPMAREGLAAEGLSDRVTLVAGDFYTDELPRGCDLALLSAIIHQNSVAQNLDLYGRVFRALDAGGSILIRDHIMDDSHTSPPDGALFAINMLVVTNGGTTYSFKEVRDGLVEAGFTDVVQVRAGNEMDGLVEARKPDETIREE